MKPQGHFPEATAHSGQAPDAGLTLRPMGNSKEGLLPLPEFRALMGMMRCPRNLLPSSITATLREASSGIRICREFRIRQAGEGEGGQAAPLPGSRSLRVSVRKWQVLAELVRTEHTQGHTHRCCHSSCCSWSMQGRRAAFVARGSGVSGQTAFGSFDSEYP